MDLTPSPRALDLRDRVVAFMDEHIRPNEMLYFEQQGTHGDDLWRIPPILETVRAKAKAEGLWTLFLPPHLREGGLSNIDYAPIAEAMGHVH